MSPEERRRLIARLERPLEEVMPAAQAHRLRWGWLGMMTGGTLVLIPWIVYLSIALPDSYLVHGWTATWVGFDVLLAALMAATVVLGFLRRQLMLLTAFATGVLLVCDAWFDLMTAGPDDVWLSVVTGLGIELPLAIFMITGAQRIMRLTMMRLWLLDPKMRLWHLPLFP
jgi:hypothetical protein